MEQSPEKEKHTTPPPVADPDAPVSDAPEAGPATSQISFGTGVSDSTAGRAAVGSGTERELLRRQAQEDGGMTRKKRDETKRNEVDEAKAKMKEMLPERSWELVGDGVTAIASVGEATTLAESLEESTSMVPGISRLPPGSGWPDLKDIKRGRVPGPTPSPPHTSYDAPYDPQHNPHIPYHPSLQSPSDTPSLPSLPPHTLNLPPPPPQLSTMPGLLLPEQENTQLRPSIWVSEQPSISNYADDHFFPPPSNPTSIADFEEAPRFMGADSQGTGSQGTGNHGTGNSTRVIMAMLLPREEQHTVEIGVTRAQRRKREEQNLPLREPMPSRDTGAFEDGMKQLTDSDSSIAKLALQMIAAVETELSHSLDRSTARQVGIIEQDSKIGELEGKLADETMECREKMLALKSEHEKEKADIASVLSENFKKAIADALLEQRNDFDKEMITREDLHDEALNDLNARHVRENERRAALGNANFPYADISAPPRSGKGTTTATAPSNLVASINSARYAVVFLNGVTLFGAKEYTAALEPFNEIIDYFSELDSKDTLLYRALYYKGLALQMVSPKDVGKSKYLFHLAVRGLRAVAVEMGMLDVSGDLEDWRLRAESALRECGDVEMESEE